MTKKLLLAAISAALFVSGSALADKKDFTEKNEEGRVLITWQSPQDYRDIRSATTTRAKYRQTIFKELDKAFEKLAEDLPEGQVLELKVTNLDLAGQVWPSSFVGLGDSGGDIRVIKRLYIPSISFSYSLKDASGSELMADDVKIKDMNFLDRPSVQLRHRPFSYEKRMIKDWFDDTFSESLAKL